ncbi:hypothetical protein ES703_34321 [subsurface metagenome]
MPEEKDKKLEYLQREEVRTMQKDVAKLREAGAQKERQRVSELKTAQESQKERERQEKARQAALDREKAEKEAQRKREGLKTLKEKRGKKAEITEKEGIKKEQVRTEEFKESLRQAQAREEEERKKFLERIQAKSEEEAPLIPSKPPLPPPPEMPKKEVSEKKVSKISFKRPSFAQKLWIRVVLTLLLVAIIAGIATFWYWYLVVREVSPHVPPITKEEAFIPPALISTENIRTLEISNSIEIPLLLSQTIKEDLGENQFTRILIKNTEENNILGLKEFFESFAVVSPQDFYEKTDNDFTLFIYSSQGENRLGFIAETKEELLSLLKTWETTMEADFENLFLVLGKTDLAPVPEFKEADYEDEVFRYLSFPSENFGICWALVDNYLIFTSSGESILRTIDKINE